MNETLIAVAASPREAVQPAPGTANARPRLDDEELAHIVRIVRAALAAENAAQERNGSQLQRALEFCQKYWVMVTVLGSLLVVVVSALWFHADPFYKLKEVAVAGEVAQSKQDKFKFDREMSQRYVALGERYLDVWQMDEADKAFAEALELNGTDLEAAKGQIKARIFAAPTTGRYDPEVIERRIAVVQEMSVDVGEKPKADPHALTALADIHALVGDWDAAKPLYEQAIALRGSLAHAYLGLGLTAIQQARNADAEAALERAVEISPNNWLYRNNHADALAKLGRTDDALREFAQVSRLNHDLPLPYLERARLHRQRGSNRDLSMVVQLTARVQQMFTREAIAGAEAARGGWQFETQSGAVSLFSLPEKRAYVALSYAVSRFVAQADEVQDVGKAQAAALQAGAPASLRLIDSDLAEIERVRPDLAERLNRLRAILKMKPPLAEPEIE